MHSAQMAMLKSPLHSSAVYTERLLHPPTTIVQMKRLKQVTETMTPKRMLPKGNHGD
jgi:hypothetical protein